VALLFQQPLTTADLTTLLAPRILAEVESLQTYSEAVEAELAKELENGRLFRLMAKLGFINERPEYDCSCVLSSLAISAIQPLILLADLTWTLPGRRPAIVAC
jgi:hypothetical protein